MSDMVERVGLEILDELESRKGFRQVIDEIENDGADLYDEVRDAVGRAAIAAMREPTEVMVRAGSAAVETECSAEDVWDEMSIAALRERSP